MEIKNFIQVMLKESLNEGVEIDHSRHMRAHGKKASGSGSWIFTSKDMGEPSADEMVTVNGPLSAAGKEAAKKLKTNRVYVMESLGSLDEVAIIKDRRKYSNVKWFETDKEANAFLEKNPEYGVLQADKGGVYVALNKDKGKPIK
jgi:hypothetical protein